MILGNKDCQGSKDEEDCKGDDIFKFKISGRLWMNTKACEEDEQA
jgi:hypothetical protein